MPYVEDGQQEILGGPRETTLRFNRWASWCQPCLRELNELRINADALRESEIELLVLRVDELDPTSRPSGSVSAATQVDFSIAHGLATEGAGVRAMPCPTSSDEITLGENIHC